MYTTSLDLTAPKLTSYLGSSELQRRTGRRDSVIAVYQAFDPADDPITLALGIDKIHAFLRCHRPRRYGQ